MVELYGDLVWNDKGEAYVRSSVRVGMVWSRFFEGVWSRLCEAGWLKDGGNRFFCMKILPNPLSLFREKKDQVCD